MAARGLRAICRTDRAAPRKRHPASSLASPRPARCGDVGGGGMDGTMVADRDAGHNGTDAPEEEHAAAIAHQWLDRYGVVTRDWWRRERPPVAWASIIGSSSDSSIGARYAAAISSRDWVVRGSRFPRRSSGSVPSVTMRMRRSWQWPRATPRMSTHLRRRASVRLPLAIHCLVRVERGPSSLLGAARWCCQPRAAVAGFAWRPVSTTMQWSPHSPR